MQQLTTQDSIFLSMETPELPGHIGGLAFLAPTEGYDFSYDSFVEFVRDRLGSVERFSWALQEVPFGLDRPYWVKQDDFDPGDHVHSIRIPEPYSDESLAKLAGRIFERPMDRSRPLWDMVLIEGLPGGRYGMLWRMHHCMLDGASGANLSEQLFDISPDAKRDGVVPVDDAATAGKPVSDARIWTNAARNMTELPARQAKILGKLIEGALKTPVQTAVKRVDEQEFAKLNGQNLMFCEDSARRLKQALDGQPCYQDFWLRVNHLESLHAHNAVAIATKEVEGGYLPIP